MPWCPKCKTEYRKGIRRCSDCDTELVDTLPEELVCILTLPEETALDLLAYYEYLGVDYSILEFDKASGQYQVLVPKSKEEDIQKPTADYFLALKSKETAAPPKDPTAASAPFKQKKEQLEDVETSASAFLWVGGGGMVLIVLILAGVIPFPFAASSRILTLSVMSLLFLFFLGTGISSLRKLHPLKEEAKQEDTQVNDILSWFTASYTKEDIDSNSVLDDPEELNYYQRIAYMKERIRSKYLVDEDLLDSISDTLYSKYFD